MNIKNEKGSITMFVLVGLLFMIGFLIILFGNNVNKSKSTQEQFNIMSGIYSYGDGDESAYNRAYTALRKKNKQILTATVEDTSILEINRTYEEKVDNYKIYGNTIQDETLSEIQSVGNTNLFDINSVTTFSNILGETELNSVSDGIITCNYGYYGMGTWCNSNISKLPIGKYTLSCEVLKSEASGDARIYIGYYKTRSTRVNTPITVEEIGEWKHISFTFEITEETEIIGWQFQGDKNQSTGDYKNLDIKFKNIQLEVGEEASSYLPYGEYKIPIRFSNENGKTETVDIYLSAPLKKSGTLMDYIDYKKQKVIWQVDYQKEESITLPDILTYEDYTKIEILTQVEPSKIEVDYVGYALE